MSIPLLTPPAVPLIGQPLTVLSATILPLVQCHCEQGGSLVLVAQILSGRIVTAPAECPTCHRTFLLRGFTQDAAGAFQYAIEMTDPARES